MIKKIMIISMLTLSISSFSGIAAEADNMEKQNMAPHSMDMAPNPSPYKTQENLGSPGVQSNPGMQSNMKNDRMSYNKSSATSMDSTSPTITSIDYRTQPMTSSSMQDSGMHTMDRSMSMDKATGDASHMKGKMHHKSMMKHGKKHIQSHGKKHHSEMR